VIVPADAPLYAGIMETHAEIVQRWRDLRTMLIDQLEMFETGALTLRSNGVNISSEAIVDLRRSILEFDALIAKDEAEAR
jgi:hypothetical protein